jgi:serine/threonine-protein kinase
VWSLGIILFELVSGRVPFESESVTDLAIKIATAAPLSLRALVPGLPAGFEAVVERCIEKERELRFPNVGELASALAPYAPSRAAASVERTLRTVQTARASLAPGAGGSPPVDALAVTTWADPGRAGSNTAAAWGTTRGARRRRRGAMFAGVMVGPLVLLLGVGGWLVVRSWRSNATSGLSPSAATSLAESTSLPEPSLPASSVAVVPSATGSAPGAEALAPTTSARPTAGSAAPATRPVRPPRPGGGGAPTAKPGCSPPYVIDSAGHRQYKPECL